jgi:hypothetical protein
MLSTFISISARICSNASQFNLSSTIVDLNQVLSRRNVEKLLSALETLTAKVAYIFKRRLIAG